MSKSESSNAHAVANPMLRPGDEVAVVSPASYPEPAALESLVAELRNWGLRPRLGRNVLSRHGFMAGPDPARADDLNAAIRDEEVRAIFASRGGAGSYRIADLVDWDALRSDPKPLVGFSDITHLHLGWFFRSGVASVHGAADGRRACEQLRSVLLEGAGNTVTAYRRSPLAVLTSSEGCATGPLVGGNLRELAGAVGCGLPGLAGAILVLEDLRHVGLGQIDRNLVQLRRSGVLDGLQGVVLGHFSGFDDYVDRGWRILDVLTDNLSDLDAPILAGVQVGHGLVGPDGEPDQDVLVLGSSATIDCASGTLACNPLADLTHVARSSSCLPTGR